MTDSILTSTKKILGIAEDDVSFDLDILMHINSVFSTLTQIGLGPEDGYAIEDETSTWDEFLENNFKLNSVKTYMYIRVRLLFDPPNNQYLVASLDTQRQEIEYRLSVEREGVAWVDPNPIDDVVIDGGGP